VLLACLMNLYSLMPLAIPTKTINSDLGDKEFFQTVFGR